MANKTKDTDYSKTIAKIRVFEKYMLKKQELDKMCELTRLEEAFKILSDAGWHFPGEETDPGKILSSQEQWLFAFLKEVVFEEEFLHYLLIKTDYRNIKAFLKQELAGQPIRNELFLKGGTIPVPALLKSLTEREQGMMDKRMFEAFSRARETYLEHHNPQQIDLILDEALTKELSELAERFGNRFVLEYHRAQTDMTNLMTLLRIRKFSDDAGKYHHVFLEGGSIDPKKLALHLNSTAEECRTFLLSTDAGKPLEQEIDAYFTDGSLTGLEKGFDNLMIDRLKPARFIMFGPEPVFVYAKYMENELRAVRIILNGIASGLSAESMKERLRSSYA